jgi:hypothetical protein
MDIAGLRNELATTDCETAAIEFKSHFDPEMLRDRVEVVKDIVALHNSGGGVIVFGLLSDGSAAGDGAGCVSPVDPAKVTDWFRSYTGVTPEGVIVTKVERCSKHYDAWFVPGGRYPVPFKDPGQWEKPDKKQQTVFSRGQIYFRHGAKSEPATHDDMQRLHQRITEEARVKFVAEMQNVARLPDGYTVQAVPANMTVSVPGVVTAVRVTNNPTAVEAIAVDKHKFYPDRLKETLAKLATRLPGGGVGRYEIDCIRKVHRAEIESKEYIWCPPRCSPLYRQDFVDWIVGRIEADPEFVTKAKQAAKALAAA